MIDKKKICATCVFWELGDYWGTGSGNHGVLVESKGWCMGKKNKKGEVVKRKRWNYCPACELYSKRKMNGFFYQGGGGNTIEEDLNNINELMKETFEDNE